MQEQDISIEEVEEIELPEGKGFIEQRHYRKTLPRINKMFFGGFHDGKLVAVMTLGWGTQPANTIKKIFPSLGTKDYYEIGRLCLDDRLPRNSESNFISRVIKRLKMKGKTLVLFSWSDGIMGKPGYVYQGSNFMYVGKIKTSVYITKEGYLIHPRSAKTLLDINARLIGKKKLCWLKDDFLERNNIIKLVGYQYKYIYFTCSHKDRKRLLKECKVQLPQEYPKYEDIKFFRKIDGKYRSCEFPLYKETLNAEEVSRATRLISNQEGLVQFQHSASNNKEGVS